jgi:hypothetical protein
VFTPPSLSLTFLALTAAFIGFAVGALSGITISRLLKLNIRFRNVVVDGILGSAGFSIGWFVVLSIPWRNTITDYVDQTLVTSTTGHYQHPYLVAFAAAMLLPIMNELRRYRKLRKTDSDVSHFHA